MKKLINLYYEQVSFYLSEGRHSAPCQLPVGGSMLVEESQVGPELLHLVKKKRMFLEDTDSAPEQIPEKQPVKVKARVVSVKQSEPLEDLGLTDDELALLEDLESEEN